MTAESWEDRMAAKAAARRAAAEEQARRERHEAYMACQVTVDEWLEEHAMTPSDAREYLAIIESGDFACACSGPPTELCEAANPPCRCELNDMRARAALRGQP